MSCREASSRLRGKPVELRAPGEAYGLRGGFSEERRCSAGKTWLYPVPLATARPLAAFSCKNPCGSGCNNDSGNLLNISGRARTTRTRAGLLTSLVREMNVTLPCSINAGVRSCEVSFVCFGKCGLQTAFLSDSVAAMLDRN